jgi:hypothetical protein
VGVLDHVAEDRSHFLFRRGRSRFLLCLQLL